MGTPHVNGTVSTADDQSSGAAITGGYMGDSFTIKVLVVLFPALSMYNALELLVLIFFTFNRYRGVYFWSLLIASTGVIPYSLGFLFKFGNITEGNLRWLSVALLTIGWWTIVTGQSVVLWSRLHLILEGAKGQRTLRWTKWMIAIDAIILHIPTTVLTWGSNGSLHTDTFARAYNIMEKIQMSGFFLQEVILSLIYIVATVKILKTSVREHTQKFMWQLMFVNIVIIVMDIALLSLEAASLYLLETLCKGVIYSVKLKLEFAILGQLVKFVGRPSGSITNDERMRRASVTYAASEESKKVCDSKVRGTGPIAHGVSYFTDSVDLTKSRSQNTYHSTFRSFSMEDQAVKNRQRSRSDSVRLPPGMTRDELDVVMFQHTEDTSLAENGALTPVDQTTLPISKSKPGDGAV